jgi:hypothetical protein
MVLDAGRIKHLGDLMHKSIASNGTAVTSNWKLSADGLQNVVWTPESTSSVSYGSNSNEVSYNNAPGASSLVSRVDHVHRGVTSLSHASNTYTGPVTLETEGSLYIVRSAANVYRLGSTGTAAGGGGGGSALVGASYIRSSGNYTTTSTTFVDIDGTNTNFTITTGAHRVMCGFVGEVDNNTLDLITYLDVEVDGTRLGNAQGLTDIQEQHGSGQYLFNGSFTAISAVLTAGSHTFKFRWRVNGGTGKISGGSAGESAAQFWVMEQGG